MTYHAPLREIDFVLSALAGADGLAAVGRYAEATPETRRAVLAEAGRLCAAVLAPLNAVGDRAPARIENGVVRLPPGFAEGWAAIRDGGWCGVTAEPEDGGLGLPLTVWAAVGEMMSGANLALGMAALLTAGQAEALAVHAPPALRRLVVPNLVAGRWTGTMNLTEPQAGTDVGAVRMRAEPDGEGRWRLTGQKIYVSWGDHDAAENVSHLVLARIAGAPPGAKGLSLFLVPKMLTSPDGGAARPNGVSAVALERKMGLHGAPTCVMDYADAAGFLVGPPNLGLMAMFTMMNGARLGVGMQGVGVAEAACQRALAWARARRQGRTLLGDGRGPILDHPDVRRMLATMRARTQAARAVGYACAAALDFARAAPRPERAAWAARAAFLTPVAKAFGSETGCEVAALGVQVHGGAGYVEATGAAQLYRDVRVTAIYEGTNGVQALDLATRKLDDGGDAAMALLAELDAAAISARRAHPDLAARLALALAELRRATVWMLAVPTADRAAGATPFLRAWALALGAHFLLKGALVDPARAPLAAFFVRQELPALGGLAAAATEGVEPLRPEELVA